MKWGSYIPPRPEARPPPWNQTTTAISISMIGMLMLMIGLLMLILMLMIGLLMLMLMILSNLEERHWHQVCKHAEQDNPHIPCRLHASLVDPFQNGPPAPEIKSSLVDEKKLNEWKIRWIGSTLDAAKLSTSGTPWAQNIILKLLIIEAWLYWVFMMDLSLIGLVIFFMVSICFMVFWNVMIVWRRICTQIWSCLIMLKDEQSW